jgi:hypothetical protein
LKPPIRDHGVSASDIKILALNTPRQDDITLAYNRVDMFVVSCPTDLVQSMGTEVDLNLDTNVLNGDSYLSYWDQIFSLEYNDYDHCGFALENYLVWSPELIEAYKRELARRQKMLEQPLTPLEEVKIDIQEKQDNTKTQYEKK